MLFGASADLGIEDGPMESIRVDRWLWSVRLFKTRSAATEACRAGHVRINGVKAKPASTVSVGDEVRARSSDRHRIVEVARIVPARVGAAVAAECLIDRSPEPPPAASLPPLALRKRGEGRPTKRERRQLEKWRKR